MPLRVILGLIVTLSAAPAFAASTAELLRTLPVRREATPDSSVAVDQHTYVDSLICNGIRHVLNEGVVARHRIPSQGSGHECRHQEISP